MAQQVQAGRPGPLPMAPPLTAAPDAYAPDAYAGAPYQPHGPAWLRSPVVIGKVAAAAIGVAVATDLVAVWSGYMSYDVADRLAGDRFGAVAAEDIDRADTIYTVTGLVQTIAFSVAVILFLVWFHRARVNAEVFSPSGHRMKRGWTCWSWFVPIVNLWFPRRVMVDVWDASSPAGRASHGLVNVWWTLWVVSLIANRAGSTAYRRAETAEEIRDAAGQVMFADLTDMVAGVLAVLVVLRLTRMQDEKARGGSLVAAV
ncbi:DUF4328 domain-containing protein [Streptomyces sp. NPDC048484]|uniref:DUF4328 domain-containing protein n=1 Tax=Streptomyces sp. NPDC048484 TaxID=3155146 RepID=UPI003431A24E